MEGDWHRREAAPPVKGCDRIVIAFVNTTKAMLIFSEDCLSHVVRLILHLLEEGNMWETVSWWVKLFALAPRSSRTCFHIGEGRRQDL